MYKKVLFLAALGYAVPHHACNATPWLEVKPSYFFFTAAPMRDVYRHGGFEVQGSVSVPVCANLDLYGSIGYREAWGRALNSGEKTSLRVIPVDFGVKPTFNFCERWYYFFTIGPRYFHFNQQNKSPYVDCKISSDGMGFFINTGFNVLLADSVLLGLFGEYSFERKGVWPNKSGVFSNGSVQIGGFAAGVSVGYAF